MVKADEPWANSKPLGLIGQMKEIDKLRKAIWQHMEQSLDLVRNDPRVRLSEADYQLWEVLND